MTSDERSPELEFRTPKEAADELFREVLKRWVDCRLQFIQAVSTPKNLERREEDLANHLAELEADWEEILSKL